jgi:hypothetical protein
MSFKVLKFNDADLPIGTAASETQVEVGNVETQQQQTTQEQPQSIAALMAQHGRKSEGSGGERVVTPININGGNVVAKEVAQVQETAKVENEQQVTETPTQVETETPTETPQVATQVEQPQVELSWKEVLKKTQPEEVLSELGYDRKAIDISKEIGNN